MAPIFNILIVTLIIQYSYCTVGAFDYFQFVMQYQPSFCKKNACISTPSPVFSIHGLWPSNLRGAGPRCTATTTVDKAKLKAMEAQLAPIWPNLKGDNVDFWTHEWDRHGTCSQLTQDTYFLLTQRLYKNYGVTALLEKAGIHPDQGKMWTLVELEMAIKVSTTKQPALKCFDDGKIKTLDEIVICLDNAGANPVDCPSRPAGLRNCPTKDIKY